MNTFRKPCLVIRILECILLACAAGLLLRATWLPVFKIKILGELNLESMGMWATHAARYTFIAALLCLPLRPLGVSRWWMALSVGILFGPLASLAGQAIDLANSLATSENPVNLKDVVQPLTGAKFCAAGLACWLLDLLVALGGLICGWCRKRVPRVLSDPACSVFHDPSA